MFEQNELSFISENPVISTWLFFILCYTVLTLIRTIKSRFKNHQKNRP